jgi:hypothetical protein
VLGPKLVGRLGRAMEEGRTGRTESITAVSAESWESYDGYDPSDRKESQRPEYVADSQGFKISTETISYERKFAEASDK